MRPSLLKRLAPSLTVGFLHSTNSEISLTGFVPAVTIDLDCFAGAFTRRAAVVALVLRRTGTCGIFAFVFVGHDISLILIWN